jgi:hypothetical protein
MFLSVLPSGSVACHPLPGGSFSLRTPVMGDVAKKSKLVPQESRQWQLVVFGPHYKARVFVLANQFKGTLDGVFTDDSASCGPSFPMAHPKAVRHARQPQSTHHTGHHTGRCFRMFLFVSPAARSYSHRSRVPRPCCAAR